MRDKYDIVHKMNTIQNHLTSEQYQEFLMELLRSVSKAEFLQKLNDKYEWAIK